MSVPSRAVNLASRDGTRLAATAFEPQQPRGTVVLCHGMGEHSGRYAPLAELLAREGLRALLFDFRGHGQSAGARGHVDAFEEYLDDLDAAMQFRLGLEPPEPCFLFGHSMGGVIATDYLLRRASSQRLRGLVLSSPGFQLGFAVPLHKRILSCCLLPFAPKLRVDSGIRTSHLTSVSEKQRAFDADPTTYSSISLRWFAEFERASAECMGRASEITLPLLVCVGALDPVVAPAAVERFVRNASSVDKTFRAWDGLLHEPLNEPAGEEVARTIVTWISARMAIDASNVRS